MSCGVLAREGGCTEEWAKGEWDMNGRAVLWRAERCRVGWGVGVPNLSLL